MSKGYATFIRSAFDNSLRAGVKIGVCSRLQKGGKHSRSGDSLVAQDAVNGTIDGSDRIILLRDKHRVNSD